MAVTRVPVPPEMLLWACERAGFDVAHLAKRMPQPPRPGSGARDSRR